MSAALFVDGAALSIALRRCGHLVDLRRLVGWAEDIAGPLTVRYWFDGTLDGTPNGFHRAAAHAGGFRLKINPKAPREFGPDGKLAYKQVGVDVALAVHAMRSLERDRWTTLVLVAGDGDFYPLAEHLVEQRGVRLIVLASLETTSAMLTCYATHVYVVESLLGNIATPEQRLAL